MKLKMYIVCFVLLFGGDVSYGQECDCEKDFDWVKVFMERNHPGFNSDIKSPHVSSYKVFTENLRKQIKESNSSQFCIAYLKKYIRYLKDHHSNIYEASKPIREDNPDSVASFRRSALFLSTEKIMIDSLEWVKRLQNQSNSASIEGIYYTPDTAYTIAVIENKTKRRDYIGVILSSKTRLWERGQVKLEMKLRGDTTVEMYSLLRNHSVDYNEWNYVRSNFDIPGWKKFGSTSNVSKGNSNSDGITDFRILDSATVYLGIRSFGGMFNRYLDSIYKVIIPQIEKYPKLIIDVRGNGGGNDNNYAALMPFIYTDPIYNDYVELFVSDDNVKAYEHMRDEAKAYPDKFGKSGFMVWELRLNQMKNKPLNSFIGISSKNHKTTHSPHLKPSKVVILFDRFCASSCEQLLLDASFSKKTILVGENSGGYIAYGNVMNAVTPCGRQLSWTTTRKNSDRQYEFVGIPPQVRVPPEEKDWISFARDLLNQ